MKNDKITKLMTKSPLCSILIFSFFVILINYLVTNYHVEKYEQIDAEICLIEKENSRVLIKVREEIELYEGMKGQLIYSLQNQVKEGKIVEIYGDRIYMEIENLGMLEDTLIYKSNVKVCTGKESIKEQLQ